MASRKHYQKGGAPDGEDIRTALKAFEDDLQLKARLMWYGGDDTDLVIIVEVFREINGERIGICKKRSVWENDGTNVITRCLQAIYYAYHEATELAYYDPKNSPKGRGSSRK